MTSETPDAATEAKAIARLVEVLEGLDRPAIARVLTWALDRYGVAAAARKRTPSGSEGRDGEEGDFKDLASLYNAADPSTEAEKALVAGYWHQVCQKEKNLDAQRMNRDLKHLGHEVSNITRACGELIANKPRLMIQVHKSGSSKQARKKYRLTEEGIKRVKQVIAAKEPKADEK